MASKCSLYFSLHCNIDEVKWSEVNSLSRVRLFATPWTVAYQASQTMGFSRLEYLSGVPFPSPGGSSRPWDQTWVSCIVGRCFTLWATRDAFGELEESEAEGGRGSQHPQSQGPLIPSSAQRAKCPVLAPPLKTIVPCHGVTWVCSMCSCVYTVLTCLLVMDSCFSVNLSSVFQWNQD